MIITIICITILAYAIGGKDINGLLDKLIRQMQESGEMSKR